MEANRTLLLRRMDYLLRQIHVEALHRREEFTEVIYLRTHIRIPPSAFRVIDRLRVKATRVSDLATELRESLPTVARLVQQLETKGLVERTRDETDARASIVRLSPLGVELEHTMRMERRDHISLCLEDWSDDQLGELLPLARKADRGFHEARMLHGAVGGIVRKRTRRGRRERLALRRPSRVRAGAALMSFGRLSARRQRGAGERRVSRTGGRGQSSGMSPRLTDSRASMFPSVLFW